MQIRHVNPTDELYPVMLQRFPSTARYIADPQDPGDYHFFAAVEGEHGVIGGAVLDLGPLRFGPLAEMTVGFLENIEVDEPFRRRGVGRALLEAVLGFAWRWGAQNVRWTVDWANAPGVAFYAACGVGVIPEGDSPQTAEPYYTLVAVNPQRPHAGHGHGQAGATCAPEAGRPDTPRQ